MKNYLSLLACICSLAILQWACNSASADEARVAAMVNPPVTNPAPGALPVVAPTNDPATILNRPEVPILCYHQLRDWKASDSKTARDYIVPVATFREQMKALAD